MQTRAKILLEFPVGSVEARKNFYSVFAIRSICGVNIKSQKLNEVKRYNNKNGAVPK